MGEKSEILMEGGRKVVEGTKKIAQVGARAGAWVVTSTALALQEKTDMM